MLALPLSLKNIAPKPANLAESRITGNEYVLIDELQARGRLECIGSSQSMCNSNFGCKLHDIPRQFDP